MLDFNENYFLETSCNIKDNSMLREPQIEAYYKSLEYFSNEPEQRNALIVLPTGVGKTGVMGLLPFGLCKKRTLIITPGTTIRDTVIDSLNPANPENFWYKRNIIEKGFILPSLVEYEGSDTPTEVLDAANIVVLNVQKLQSRLNSTLIKRVPNDFFDLIIIDEAHHSTATTWVETIRYFKDAKIIKLTGTPFRTDGDQIVGKLIYKYPLSRAMYNGYVKSLSNLEYLPDELFLTLDDNTSKLYTVDEILDMGLRDSEWITRSVAYSPTCSEKIVDKSISELNIKRENSNIPHKIIAIACSITHAKQIQQLYLDKGMIATIIHSELQPSDKAQAFKDIDNHRVDVVINVAMLGEGYDHPYLTIAAIFRPFRNELPYTQFIGRVLRYIPEGSANDNIAIIISHHHLYLDKLWIKYKKEIQESEIIKALKNYEEEIDNSLDDLDSTSSSRGPQNVDKLGDVQESISHNIVRDDYLTTELIKKSKEEEEKFKIQLKIIQETLGISEEKAKILIKQSQTANSGMLSRPDLLYKNNKKGLNNRIQEEIIPQLIEKHNIDKDGIDIKDSGLFIGPLFWSIPNRIVNGKYPGKNAAMLAIYINTYLKDKIGLPRQNWTDSDYKNAFIHLDTLVDFIDSKLKIYYNK